MKLNTFMLILSIFGLICFVSPVMAENGTINYDYTLTDSVNVIYSGGLLSNTKVINSFETDDITQYESISTIVSSVSGWTAMEEDTYDTQFTLKIGTDTVASGTYYIWRSRIDGKLTGHNILTFLFDSYDISGYTGKQKLVMDIGSDYLPIADITLTGTSITPETGYFKIHAAVSGTCYVTQTTTIYRSVEFHQNMVYDLTDEILSLTMTKNGYTNNINITNIKTGTVLSQSSADDFSYVYPNIEQVLIEVENPITNTIWSNTIPETSTPGPVTPGPVYDSIIHMSVYDAVTRNLINGHNVTLQYDDNSPIFTTWDGPISHTSIDWFNGQAANVTYSAEGYDPSPTHRYVMSVVDLSGQWLKAGESRTGNVYLNPIAPPSNVTAYAIFDVLEDMPNGNTFYSSGAAVTIGNTTLITAGQGSCSFELSPGNYQYIVKKVGYQTVSGSFVLGASNKYITVNLPKVQTAPTAPQPTGTAGVDYPYKEVNAREQAESSMGIIFDALPGFASLAVIVLVVSFVGWMTPKKRR